MFLWSWEPGILIGLAAQVGAYLVCIGPLRRFFPGSAPVPPVQRQTFLLGVLILFIGLVSPLGTLSDGYLLSAHMVQHLLLALIAPPLLLLGTPSWLFRPLLRIPFALPLGLALTGPIIAFVIFNATFAIWHVPRYYTWSLSNPLAHAVQHVAFIATATLMWWPIFSPMDELPRIAVPLQFIYLFFAAIPPTILGALLTLSGEVWYAPYARAIRVIPLSALEDQQLAGLIMWYPGGLIFLAVLTIRWFRWMRSGDEDYLSAEMTTRLRDPVD